MEKYWGKLFRGQGRNKQTSQHKQSAIIRTTQIFQTNFSGLARKYGLMEKTKTGNMLVKEILEDKGVQLSRFKQFRDGKPTPR